MLSSVQNTKALRLLYLSANTKVIEVKAANEASTSNITKQFTVGKAYCAVPIITARI